MRKELAHPDFLKEFIRNAGPARQNNCPARERSIHRRLSGTRTPNRLLFGPHFPSEGAQGEGCQALLHRQLQASSCVLKTLLQFSTNERPAVVATSNGVKLSSG